MVITVALAHPPTVAVLVDLVGADHRVAIVVQAVAPLVGASEGPPVVIVAVDVRSVAVVIVVDDRVGVAEFEWGA